MRRLLLDTNIWNYVAVQGAVNDLARSARSASVAILVAPTIVDELRRISDAGKRKKALAAVTRPEWIRLMPEIYSECMELKGEIKRLRPEWVISQPKVAEVNRLRYDWVRKTGGYWDRTCRDISDPITDESIRRENELVLARQDSYAIRQRTLQSGKQAGGTHLRHVGGMPLAGTPGWSGEPVEYWRLSSLHLFQTELMVYASPVREWLDNEIDVFAMMADTESMNRLWLHELAACMVPRQWLRGAFEFLQAWHKVTDGTPGDSTIATYLVEADQVASADKNFVKFVERCNAEAPFTTAKAVKISGGAQAVGELLKLIQG